MPEATIEATMDHAEIRPTLEEGMDEAKALFERLREVGLDYEDVTYTLEKEGVQKFAEPWQQTQENVRDKSRQLAPHS